MSFWTCSPVPAPAGVFSRRVLPAVGRRETSERRGEGRGSREWMSASRWRRLAQVNGRAAWQDGLSSCCLSGSHHTRRCWSWEGVLALTPQPRDFLLVSESSGVRAGSHHAAREGDTPRQHYWRYTETAREGGPTGGVRLPLSPRLLSVPDVPRTGDALRRANRPSTAADSCLSPRIVPILSPPHRCRPPDSAWYPRG